jgi:hypothetical protein
LLVSRRSDLPVLHQPGGVGMMGSREGAPLLREALVVAAEAAITAIDNGHDVGDEPPWRRLSRRVYAAPCSV